METKDWIILIVPIIANGIIIFILEKIFEKKRAIKNIEYEYVSTMRQKIDNSLSLHAKATMLLNTGEASYDNVMNMVQQYVDSCIEAYYYYIQNIVIFKFLYKNMNDLTILIEELNKSKNKPKTEMLKDYTLILNRIRDVLMSAKNSCIKF